MLHNTKCPKVPSLSKRPILGGQELQEINIQTTNRRRFGGKLKDTPSSSISTCVGLSKITKLDKSEDFQLINKFYRGAFGGVLYVKLKESPKLFQL
ncbi:MAG: hypothetical protein EZS28_033696 [Streblomastix strix]|uniref:Uncharacterized protein n=1 Tax=Streblomastix strix TaxID=222440 RepID=A0A5J4UK39_9EUKA|nr:MAG: hypothetical protein EZS28_033696 [Streblomastix strix]